jgi:hypothetical protein
VDHAPPPVALCDRELGSPGRADQPARDGDGRFRADQRCQAARTGSEDTATGSGASLQDKVHAAGSGLPVWLGSNVVSFAWVRGRLLRPSRHSQPRSRTVPDPGERRSALLETVLGATPQEFESPILRHADLLKHRSSAPTGWRLELRWSQLLVSVSGAGWVPPLGFIALLRLVTGIVDGPERKGTRTPKRAPYRSGLAGTVRDRPDTHRLTDRVTLMR